MRLQKAITGTAGDIDAPAAAVVAVIVLLVSSVFPAAAGQTAPENELTAAANYDEVVRDLVINLTLFKGPPKDGIYDQVAAQDAALKLSRLGKRSVPVLTEILKVSFVAPPKTEKDEKVAAVKTGAAAPKGNPHVAYYTALALSRIKLADAARPLLPILESERADPGLRQIVIEALGLELVPEAGAVLQKVASSDPDIQIRRKAIGQMTIMTNFWASSEKLFVHALSDPDDEIRIIAAKQCMYTRMYVSAIDKLIELAEKDTNPAVRGTSMLALSRMRAMKAIPAMVRICADTESSTGVHTAAQRTINLLAGTSLKDDAAVLAWWKKSGEKEYTKPVIPAAADTLATPRAGKKEVIEFVPAPAPDKKQP